MKYVRSTSMPRAWLHTRSKGFSLVEVILASALFAILLTALVGGYLYGQESTVLAGNRVRATLLAEEGLEAARNIRDSQFTDNLTVGTFGLATTTNIWNLSGVSDNTDIFTRQVTIESIDTKRKKVTSTVTWQQNPQRVGSTTLTTYLTHWMSDWRGPRQESSMDFTGTNDGLKIQVQGNFVYIVRDDGNPDFIVVNISDPASPVLVGSLALPDIPTNIAVSGNYAYVASQSNTQELQIIDISNPAAPVLVGSYDAVGTVNAHSVYIVGTSAYLVKNIDAASNEFVIVNVAVPTAPVLLGSTDLGASGFGVWVSGNYAYVATSANAAELMVVDITNSTAPVLAGPGFNAAGNIDAITIAGTGNTVFLGQGSNIRLINISNPLAPTLISTFVAANTVNDIAGNFGRDNAYVYYVTVNSTAEFGVFDVSVPATPTLVGSMNLTTLNGIAYDPVTDRAYAVGINNATELVVIMPL